MEYHHARSNDNIAKIFLLNYLHFIPSRVYPNDKKPTDNLTYCYDPSILFDTLCTVNSTNIYSMR